MAQNTMGTIYNNQGIITQGQTGNNTINVGPQRMPFDPAIGDQLISKLPAGRPITLRSVGSHADQVVADQYEQYLRNKGFRVGRATVLMMAPPPDHKISINDTDPAEVVVTIAPSAD